MNDMLVFAAATLVVFPQLLAIGALGHIAQRSLGPRFGLPSAGLAEGFASSTAATGSMAGLAAKDDALLGPP
jgi:uncharacterized membrane protein (DUF4010 family)